MIITATPRSIRKSNACADHRGLIFHAADIIMQHIRCVDLIFYYDIDDTGLSVSRLMDFTHSQSFILDANIEMSCTTNQQICLGLDILARFQRSALCPSLGDIVHGLWVIPRNCASLCTRRHLRTSQVKLVWCHFPSQPQVSLHFMLLHTTCNLHVVY